MIRSFPLAARRVRQTLTKFENGPQLLAGMARQRITGRPDELVYRVDDRLSIVCPNRAGARVPVYEVFVEDAYRLKWFTQGLGDRPVALDIGAHVGSFSLAFTRLHHQGRVEAFEASPSTAQYLERNVAANGVDDRVRCNQVALSAASGTLAFADNGAGSGLNGITSPEGATMVEVSCVSLAEAFARAGTTVEVVKIDTEGAEYDIILGSRPEDWTGVRRVVMEYHDVAGHSWTELEEFFARVGLNVMRHEPANPRLGVVWLSRDSLA